MRAALQCWPYHSQREKSAECDRSKHWLMRPPKSTADHRDAIKMDTQKLNTGKLMSFCLPVQGRVGLFRDVLGSGTLQLAAYLRSPQGMLNVQGAGSAQACLGCLKLRCKDCTCEASCDCCERCQRSSLLSRLKNACHLTSVCLLFNFSRSPAAEGIQEPRSNVYVQWCRSVRSTGAML